MASLFHIRPDREIVSQPVAGCACCLDLHAACCHKLVRSYEHAPLMMA